MNPVNGLIGTEVEENNGNSESVTAIGWFAIIDL